MLIVLALSSSNILDKSQGAAAEMVLLQFTRKAAQLQAANGKDRGWGTEPTYEGQILRKHRGTLYKDTSVTLWMLPLRCEVYVGLEERLQIQIAVLTCKRFEAHPLPH